MTASSRLGAVLFGVCIVACGAPFDETREAHKRGSLGRELYGLLCDRVGAQALREDVSGASYQAVCHPDEQGRYAERVNVAVLPPLAEGARDVSGRAVPLAEQQANRAYRVARIEALVRNREALIRALDATVPDSALERQDPSCEPSDGRLIGELANVLGRWTGLIHDETVPDFTRSVAEALEAMASDGSVQAALAKVEAREGYQPASLSYGLVRTAAAYPRLPVMLAQVAHVLGKEGEGAQALRQWTAATGQELLSLEAAASSAPLRSVTDGAQVPLLSRPRSGAEFLRELLLVRDEAFGRDLPPGYIVARDHRGMARVALDGGKIPSPFVDVTGDVSGSGPDGLADVDGSGRFVLAGAPAAPEPFLLLGATNPLAAVRDAHGRALRAAGRSELLYEYMDVQQTSLSSLLRNLSPFVAPASGSDAGSLMDLVAGMPALLARPEGADAAPVVDLTYALGQTLALQETDETLALFSKLSAENPNAVARLLKALYEVQRILDAHPEAKLASGTTFGDDLLDVLARVARKPGIFEDLLLAFGNEDVLSLRRPVAKFLTHRDRLTYDRDNLNGMPFNATMGQVSPSRARVRRDLPDTGDNRSQFQRLLHAVHESRGVSACTKDGAVAHVVWKGISFDYPNSATAVAACALLTGTLPPDRMDLCGIIRIPDVSMLLLDIALGRAEIQIQDPCLRELIKSPLTGIVGGSDAFLEEVSGVKGFSTRPTVGGINRLLFYDLPRAGHPGDTTNTKTTRFFNDLFVPVSGASCPATPFRDKDGTTVNLRTCSRYEDTFPGKLRDATFALEQDDFVTKSRPLAAAFADHGGAAEFVALLSTLHRHWGSSKQSLSECDPSLPPSDARWCSGAGVVTFEPLFAEVLEKSDLLPALHSLAPILRSTTVPHCEATDASTGRCTRTSERSGVTVLAEWLRAMVDPSRNPGLADRHGETLARRADGRAGTALTPAHLFLEGWRTLEGTLDDERARLLSRGVMGFVEQLMPVDGSGANARFRDPGLATRWVPHALSLVRAQRRAHCPDLSRRCPWAGREWVRDVTELVESPWVHAFARTMDAVRRNDAARAELEGFFTYLLDATGGAQSPRAVVSASLADFVQVLADRSSLTALAPVFASALTGPTPDGAKGLPATSLTLARQLFSSESAPDAGARCAAGVDPHGAWVQVLENAVTPMGEGEPAPLEVMLRTLREVNRRHPEMGNVPLSTEDYANLSRELHDYFTDEGSGLEQMYTLLREATGR